VGLTPVNIFNRAWVICLFVAICRSMRVIRAAFSLGQAHLDELRVQTLYVRQHEKLLDGDGSTTQLGHYFCTNQ
jgi:hypothetical protein